MFIVIKNQVIDKIIRERVTTACVLTVLQTYKNLEESVRFNKIVNLPMMKLKSKNIIFVSIFI